LPFRFEKIFRRLASLKVAIPLLVVLTVVTVIGSLFPQPDLFRTKWYLGLLGALGLSLLLITIQHIPSIRRRKGRNALVGVIVTHAGILVLIAAAIQGGTSASRWQLRAIEGEMTVVPGMPFVVELVRLTLEDYEPSEFSGLDLSSLPRKRQDSEVRLHQGGVQVAEFRAAPGRPGRFEGYTLLPSVSELGWTFELVVTDQQGRVRTIAVRPWADPTFELSGQQVLAHALETGGQREVQLLRLVDGRPQVFAVLGPGDTAELGGYEIRLGAFKPYTAMSVYNRPHMPLLVIGTLMMMAGLIWHFYHRYRN